MSVWSIYTGGQFSGAAVLGDVSGTPREDGPLLALCVSQLGLVLDGLLSRRACEMSERRLRFLVEHTTDGVMETDADGLLVQVNDRVSYMLGYGPSELRTRAQRMALVHPTDADEVRAALATVEHGHPVTRPLRATHKLGHDVFLRVTWVPILDAERVVGTYVVLADITELVAAQEQLREAEKLTLVGQLAAGVAHEIRNPLTTLQGFVKLMEEQGYPAKYLSIMRAELARIQGVTNQLLILGKPQSVPVRSINLAAAVADLAAQMQGEADERRVHLVVRGPDEVWVSGERGQLSAAIGNVIRNALEASRPQAAVEIRVSAQPPYAVVEVDDWGDGIDPERLPSVTAPFYTRKPEGVGLGLTVSQRIVAAYGGRLEVSSQPGAGTRVFISLPLAEGPGPDS